MALSNYEIEEIVALRRQNSSVSEIASDYGVSHQLVSYHCNKVGLRTYPERADKGKKRKPEEQLSFTFVDSAPIKKRSYVHNERPKGNSDSSVGISKINAYLSSVVNFNEFLAFPALSPKRFSEQYNKEIATIPDHIVSRLVNEFVQSEGIERLDKTYISHVVPAVLSNIYIAINNGKQITYSRDKNRSNHKIIRFIDFLYRAGYIINVVQPKQADPDNRYSSWFIPTEKLSKALSFPKAWTVQLSPSFKPVVIRDETKKERAPKQKEIKLIKALSELVGRFNNEVAASDIRLNGNKIPAFLRRIFNEDLEHGGRFYTDMYQTLPKAERRQITIDGEPTSEPDFEAIHPNLLFWLADMDTPTNFYDSIADYTNLSRDVVKALFLRLMNTNSQTVFKRNVSKSSNRTVKALKRANRTDVAVLKGFIDGVPDGFSGSDFIKAIERLYPQLSPFLGQPKLGLKLQYHDSNIMALVIEKCLSSGLLCLPVHDSIIVPESKREIAMELMREAYSDYTGGRSIHVG